MVDSVHPTSDSIHSPEFQVRIFFFHATHISCHYIAFYVSHAYVKSLHSILCITRICQVTTCTTRMSHATTYITRMCHVTHIDILPYRKYSICSCHSLFIFLLPSIPCNTHVHATTCITRMSVFLFLLLLSWVFYVSRICHASNIDILLFPPTHRA